MTENIPKLVTDTKPQIKGQRTPRRECNKTTPTHIIFKLQKTNKKEKLLIKKRQKKKHKDYIRLLFRTMQVRMREIFKGLKEKNNHQPRVLYPVKLSFKHEEKIKTFSDKN